MPALDGKGPRGRGPLTGRGMGPCAGARGYGRGYGIGFGRGYYCPWYYEPTKEEEKKFLEEEKKP
ncbi:MAG: DUF5320 domain-containing protein [archaeon]